MTDIEQKALAQAVAAAGRRMQDYAIMAEENVLRQSIEAHARAIEQHEAFRQEVSTVAEYVMLLGDAESKRRNALLSRFIIAKPDPLVEVLNALLWAYDDNGNAMAADFRAASKARGYEWRKIEGEG